MLCFIFSIFTAYKSGAFAAAGDEAEGGGGLRQPRCGFGAFTGTSSSAS